MSYISYLLRFSAAKTLGQKFKLSISKVFDLAGKDLSRLIKDKKALGLTDLKISNWIKSVNKKSSIVKECTPILYSKYSEIPIKEEIKFGKNWKPEYIKLLEKPSKKDPLYNMVPLDPSGENELNFLKVLTRGLPRGIKLLNAVCSLCASKNDVQIHHLKKVSDLKGKNELEKRIKAFNSKQIPLCKNCHFSIHKNDWRQTPINPKDLSKKT